jgi:hypothetical protein
VAKKRVEPEITPKEGKEGRKEFPFEWVNVSQQQDRYRDF